MKFTSLLTIGILATFNAQAFEICIDPASDTDADGYGWEQGASCLVVVEGEGENGEPLTPAAIKARSIVEPRSGEKVPVQRIYWLAEDFADKSFSGCHGYVVDPAKEEDECLSCESDEVTRYEHYADGNGRMIYQNGEVNFEAEFIWSVDQFGLYDGPLPVQAYAEITDTGIKQWLDGSQGAIGFYEHCDGLIPSSATAETETTTLLTTRDITSD